MDAETEYREALQQARDELQYFEEKRKKDIVRDLAEKLEKMGCPTNMVCEKLADDLRGYIHDRYIRKVLDDKYKQAININYGPDSMNDGKNTIEETNKAVVVVAGSGEQEQDETFPEEDEQPEPKAEVIIPTAPPSIPVDSNIHDPDRRRLEQKIDQLQRELQKAYDDIKTKNQDIAALRERIDKLESIERDRIKQDFKPATDIKSKSESVEILLPADKFSNLFMMSRSEKFGIWLTAQDGKVTWMEANYVRAKEAAKKK